AGPLLGALLATAQLLPLFEYARFYPRPQPGSPLGYLTAGSFGLREWLRLLQPDLFGSPLDGSYGPDSFLYWETRGFCGLLFLTLAVARVLAKRLDGPARAGLSLVLIALLLLPGRYNPLYYVLVHLPPFSLFRIPGRWVWLLQWGVALLAGGGVTALAQRRLPRRAVTQAAIAVLFALLTALVVAGLERVEALPLAALLTMGLAALLLVLLVPVSRLTAARRRRAMRLMLAVGLLELVVSWHGFARTRPAKDLEEPPRLLRPVLLDDNKRLLESGLAAGTDPRVVSNSGLLWGAAYLRGGREALMPTPQLAVLQDLDQARAGSSGRFQFYLDRYSVRWLVTSQPVSDPSLREVLTEQGATLYENTDARPLAYAISPRYLSAGEVTTSPEQFVDVHRVEVAEQSPDRWRLRTRFPRPMVVVLSQSAYPGWLALVDGEPSQLFGAERLFMATLVPAGEHEVTFLFDNAQVWLGRALNGLALAAWLLALMVTLPRPISPRPRSREPLPES
ncbi:MAG: hypothetical protein HUU35_12800, partial [Armatimonadetes bacterium]|nr:hypothetical protein [Armatimonadota bacterium]